VIIQDGPKVGIDYYYTIYCIYTFGPSCICVMHIVKTSCHVCAGQWQLLLDAMNSEKRVKYCLPFILYFPIWLLLPAHCRCRWLLLHLITFYDTHTHTYAHSVGLLWTSDRFLAQTFTWQHTTLTTDTNAPGRINGNVMLQNIFYSRLLNSVNFSPAGSRVMWSNWE